MKKSSVFVVFVALMGLGMSMAVLPGNVSAGVAWLGSSDSSFQRVEGRIVVVKDLSGEVLSIKIQPTDNPATNIVIDDMSQSMVKHVGENAVAVGKYTADGELKVTSWFIRN